MPRLSSCTTVALGCSTFLFHVFLPINRSVTRPLAFPIISITFGDLLAHITFLPCSCTPKKIRVTLIRSVTMAISFGFVLPSILRSTSRLCTYSLLPTPTMLFSFFHVWLRFVGHAYLNTHLPRSRPSSYALFSLWPISQPDPKPYFNITLAHPFAICCFFRRSIETASPSSSWG